MKYVSRWATEPLVAHGQPARARLNALASMPEVEAASSNRRGSQVVAMIFVRELNTALLMAVSKRPAERPPRRGYPRPLWGGLQGDRGLITDFPGRLLDEAGQRGGHYRRLRRNALAVFRRLPRSCSEISSWLCFDQLVNHIAKYQAMYHGRATCPVSSALHPAAIVLRSNA